MRRGSFKNKNLTLKYVSDPNILHSINKFRKIISTNSLRTLKHRNQINETLKTKNNDTEDTSIKVDVPIDEKDPTKSNVTQPNEVRNFYHLFFSFSNFCRMKLIRTFHPNSKKPKCSMMKM